MMRAADETLSEVLLARIWKAQRFDRADLRTTDGQPIDIVYPGRAQRGPGPDFRDALVQIGAASLASGDVEVHCRSSDWFTHGHHRDPAYARVILHVVLFSPSAADRLTTTIDGRPVPALALDGRLGGGHSLAILAQPTDSSCADIARGADPAAIAALLDQLGDTRLRGKAARFEGELASTPADEVAYRALLDALGYSQNRAPFRALADHLPAVTLQALIDHLPDPDRVLRSQALLFGMAGLLPSQRERTAPLTWLDREYVEQLEGTWALLGTDFADDALVAHTWRLQGIRPPNWPTRRIGAAGHLFAAFLPDGLAESILSLVAPSPRPPVHFAASSPRRPGPGLIAHFALDEPTSYWATHFDFGRVLSSTPARLIGADRALDIVLNVVLPLALASAAQREDEHLAASAWEIFHSLPRSSENQVTRRLIGEVFGDNRRPLVTSARRQQGLLHLAAVYCERGVDVDCPVHRLGEQSDR
ncbi:MAG: DUF2851 family protein [Chloroflexi bacterium]|nr:DUF2851 family protein [Chloroflexota bacterium]